MEVYSNAASVTAIGSPPIGGARWVERAEVAKSVSTFWWFDFDDICTEIGEKSTTEVAGNDLTDV